LEVVVSPLVVAARPRGIWAPGADAAGFAVRELGFPVVEDPSEADVVVLGAEPSYDAVERGLDAVLPGRRAALLIVLGTGWPGAERNGYLDAGSDRAAAKRLPDPRTGMLGPEGGRIYWEAEAGGEGRGVLAALDRFAEELARGWVTLTVHGGGGARVYVQSANRNRPLSAALIEIGAAAAGGELANALDRDLAVTQIEKAELERRVKDISAAYDDLAADVELALEEIGRRLDEAEERARRIMPALAGSLAARLRAAERTEAGLRSRLGEVDAQLASLRAELEAERVWVLEQVRRVAQSQAWRLGHGVVRGARTAALRRHKGTDALSAIVRRLEDDS
jgi:hypothetical protein